ncbi:MAG TPA: glycoside hydrolase family 3 N-terminal domain-containing protein, partial [Gemmatimonadaceae bacterium]|nr:glycoside hydrolase family 3 N-terminal domain-containing protein [Gemmatimonadaceae bacterium]
MSDVAQLLIPAIRWDADRGFEGERANIDAALAMGVGGFILFGGDQESVRALTKSLQQRSRTTLLIGADMERGAGQQFSGATGLPPLAAIASLGDADLVRRAARLTAREARTLGVNWDYAPVCDLDVVPENPIVGTRSLGSDPAIVSKLAAEWVDACQSEGVLACAKHFPGHGRTVADSHAELPVVSASADTLNNADLAPFRATIDAGVASIMTAHVSYPALDPSGAPATLSREILEWLLRQRLRYDNLVVTDALIMEGVRQGEGPEGSEGAVAVRALQAGCDLLLYPTDLRAVEAALRLAVQSRALDAERVQRSIRRRLKWAQWASPPNDYRRPSGSDVAWGAQLADRCVRPVRGAPPPVRGPLEVIVVDDDEGGPYPAPSRWPFFNSLRADGRVADHVDAPTAGSRGTVIVALFGDVRAWKGRPGYSAAARAAVAAACEAAHRQARDALVLQFSHPRLISEIP